MKKIVIIISIAVMIIAVGSYLFYSLIITANKTTSPNGEYLASYNRITNTIRVERVNSDMKWYFSESENPSFLWSLNSKYLAMTATGIASGNRQTQIMDIEQNNNTLIPTKLDIPTMNEVHAQIEVIEWLDSDNVLAAFSYPANEFGQTISGQFIFEISSYIVKDLNIFCKTGDK